VSLTVSSLADSGAGTLRAAILTSDVGNHSDNFTIDFGVSGTIDLQRPLPDLNNSIAIQGPGAGSLTVERAAGATFASAIVTVDVGQTASLLGLTIANGSAGGIINNGTLSVSNCALSGNSAIDAGGGIYNAGTLTVSGCILSGNSSPGGDGGAIFNRALGTATISESTLSGNSANAVTLPDGTTFMGEGGAIDNGGTMTVAGCTLSGNSAGIGGAISNTFAVIGGTDYAGTLTVRDSLLTGNSAITGGAIYNDTFSTLAVRGSTFSGNTASGFGGAIANHFGTATLQECSLFGNSAGDGGGGIFNSGTLAIKDSKVLGNIAPTGADLFTFGAVTLDDSSVGVIGP
jgi:hypothetical protein